MNRVTDPRELESSAMRRVVRLSGKRVLDIGCGDGRTTHRMARDAASVVGVDPDPDDIQKALAAEADTKNRCRFEQADIVMLDFPEESFDVVVFTRSL